MICREFCSLMQRALSCHKEKTEKFFAKKNKCSTKTVLWDRRSVILFSERKRILKGDNNMKGYTVESGYMGYVDGSYMLFASEMDYEEYMEMDNI